MWFHPGWLFSAVHWLFREMCQSVITVCVCDVFTVAQTSVSSTEHGDLQLFETVVLLEQISSLFLICVGYTISVKFAGNLHA